MNGLFCFPAKGHFHLRVQSHTEIASCVGASFVVAAILAAHSMRFRPTVAPQHIEYRVSKIKDLLSAFKAGEQCLVNSCGHQALLSR